MKNFKSSLIFIGIALALGAYVYFFERGPVKTDDKKPKLFAHFVADDVKEIKFTNPAAATDSEKVIDLQRDAQDQWRMTAPRQLKADETVLRAVLNSVGNTTPDVAVTQPGPLADYGFNTGSARADFIFKDGSRQALLVGNKDISGSSYYVKPLDQPVVYMVGTFLGQDLTKSVNDLRDHSLISTDLVQADRLTVAHGDRVLELRKNKDNSWTLARPAAGKADVMKVREVLTAVNDLRVDEFVADRDSDPKIYGLNAPRVVLTIGSAQGKDQTLLVGRDKLKSAETFAQLKGNPEVVLLSQGFVKSLDLKPTDFMDKSLLQFDASRAIRLTVTHAGRSVVYVKNNQGRWESIGRDKANDEGSGILSQLALLTVADFPPQGVSSGVDKPAFTVEVTLSDQTTRRYRFGNRNQDKIYLGTNLSPAIYLVPISVATPLEAAFNAPQASAPKP
ncbi:MAG TPA: DUF4340 domain-containing protein [bacterium]|nr:DUF4340 domain-containing protein [bacterium]